MSLQFQLQIPKPTTQPTYGSKPEHLIQNNQITLFWILGPGGLGLLHPMLPLWPPSGLSQQQLWLFLSLMAICCDFFLSHVLCSLSPTAQSQHRPGPRKPISWLQGLQLLMTMMSIAEQGSFCPGSRSRTRGGQFAAASKACARPRPGGD